MHSPRTRNAVLSLALLGTVSSLSLSTAEAATDYRVAIASVTKNATVGTTFVLTGNVFPIAAGSKVRVQSRAPGTTTWSTVKTATLTTQSKYKVTVKQAFAGTTGYRVVKPAASGHGQGISPVLKVTGWRWKSFSTIPLKPETTFGTMTYHKTATVKGVSFASTLTQAPNDELLAHAEYALNGRCAKVDTWVGGASNSASNDAETASIFGDSDVTLSGKVVARNKAAVRVVLGPDVVKPIQTIKFELTNLEAGNKVAWGTLRAYCKF